MTQPRRSTVGRLVWWAFWVVLIVYVVRHPGEAAANARALVAGLDSAAESVIAFFSGRLAVRGDG